MIFSCKNERTDVLQKDETLSSLESTKEQAPKTISKLLFASLDRLRIRTDSSMNASTAVTISEKDTLSYLDQHSIIRPILKLRGQYHFEPWLKVRHQASGKTGWVYGGAVKYKSTELKNRIANDHSYVDELNNDDLEWEGTVPASWESATIRDPRSFKMFLIMFKEMVRTDNSEAIAELIRYPIKDVTSKSQFIDRYQSIMTSEVKEAILNQRLDRIFRNSNGAIIDGGKMVFHQVGKDFRVVSIDFKGRDDLIQDIIKSLSDTYTASDSERDYAINVFMIRGYLELTLNYKDDMGRAQSKSLGKYIHETSRNNKHAFYQESQSPDRRRLMFHDQSDFVEMELQGQTDPPLEGLRFTVVREI